MRISTIIPCHNAARWITRTLRSVAEQVVQPHEVIVIDDGSTDDSLAVIKASDVKVTLLERNFRNAAAARNAGIEVASGDWIAFLDADDIWTPTHLQHAVELLERTDDVAFLSNYGHLELDDQRGPLPWPHPIKETRAGIPAKTFIELMAQHFCFGHSTVLLRLDRVRQVGMFDVSQIRRHDTDLWFRVIRDHTWAYEARIGAWHRYNTPDSISRNVIECEYYFCRSLARNRDGFEGRAMDQLLTTSAKRATSLAFVNGTTDDYRRARAEAWPHLPGGFRLFYRASAICPPLFRWAIRMKRRLVAPRLSMEDAA